MAMADLQFYHPQTLDEAFAFMSKSPETTKAAAGGTDLCLQIKEKQIDVDALVDLVPISELRSIQERNGSIVLGPTVTLNEVARHPLMHDHFPGLTEAAFSIGSPQIRNRGTLGGNIGRASPAGDCSVALLSLDGRIRLRRTGGTRVISLDEFFVGPGEHIGQRDELITEIILAPRPVQAGSSFLKLGRRKALVLAIAAVAAYVELDEKANIKEARIALGSLAPTPRRSPQAEGILRGARVSFEAFEAAGQAALEDISPIDDLRASAEYRKSVTPVLVRRALISAATRAGAILLSEEKRGDL
jgi:CO/xanthine dehydrogenase FAD-binding subunit